MLAMALLAFFLTFVHSIGNDLCQVVNLTVFRTHIDNSVTGLLIRVYVGNESEHRREVDDFLGDGSTKESIVIDNNGLPVYIVYFIFESTSGYIYLWHYLLYPTTKEAGRKAVEKHHFSALPSAIQEQFASHKDHTVRNFEFEYSCVIGPGYVLLPEAPLLEASPQFKSSRIWHLTPGMVAWANVTLPRGVKTRSLRLEKVARSHRVDHDVTAISNTQGLVADASWHETYLLLNFSESVQTFQLRFLFTADTTFFLRDVRYLREDNRASSSTHGASRGNMVASSPLRLRSHNRQGYVLLPEAAYLEASPPREQHLNISNIRVNDRMYSTKRNPAWVYITLPWGNKTRSLRLENVDSVLRQGEHDITVTSNTQGQMADVSWHETYLLLNFSEPVQTIRLRFSSSKKTMFSLGTVRYLREDHHTSSSTPSTSTTSSSTVAAIASIEHTEDSSALRLRGSSEQDRSAPLTMVDSEGNATSDEPNFPAMVNSEGNSDGPHHHTSSSTPSTSTTSSSTVATIASIEHTEDSSALRLRGSSEQDFPAMVNSEGNSDGPHFPAMVNSEGNSDEPPADDSDDNSWLWAGLALLVLVVLAVAVVAIKHGIFCKR